MKNVNNLLDKIKENNIYIYKNVNERISLSDFHKSVVLIKKYIYQSQLTKIIIEINSNTDDRNGKKYLA